MPQHRRPLVLIVTALVIVAAVVVVAVARIGGDDAPFTLGNTSFSSDDAEGLITGRQARPEVQEIDDRDPLTVAFRAPGRRAFDFQVVRLEDDEPARRIRQVTREDLAVDVGGAAVSWSSWVAPQSTTTQSRASVGRWERVGPDGVLVRPGEQVRLRTVFTPGPATGACRRITLSDGPLWLVREDGSNDAWERLRYRDPRDGSDHDARSGQHGRVSFLTGSAESCAGGEDGQEFAPDAGALDD